MPEATRQGHVETPEWVKDAVFYQIFPDRFAKSARVAKPGHVEPWDLPPTDQGYKGGDLLGVVERLDHLTALGVNAIYLTPVFQSASNHRYHTHDYEKVDPLLGGDAALHELVEAAHGRGIRVVLDGVFNHASRGFLPFNDILENGAASPWLDWFTVERWPLYPYDGSRPANYVGWAGNRALPKLNTGNPQVREYLMGVAEYWLREFDIDGWRLDVPAEIRTEGFWEEFRRRVKAIKPDAYIVGEVWHEAREWLQGDRFDAVMNYLFAAAVIAFTGGARVSPAQIEGRSYQPYPPVDAAGFGARIRTLLDLYDWNVTQVQLNLLDSHDTARLLSIVRGDQATLRLATLFQMTYPGAPSIYYGDEIGLRGSLDYDQPHRDRDARWPFPWDDRAGWDQGLLEYFQQAVALRHAHPALRRGDFVPLTAAGDVFAFARRDGTEMLFVALNVAESAQRVLLPAGAYRTAGPWRQVFGRGGIRPRDDGDIVLVLPPREGMVLAA